MDRKSLRLTGLMAAYCSLADTGHVVTVTPQFTDGKTVLSFLVAGNDMLQLTIRSGEITGAMQSLYSQTDLSTFLADALSGDKTDVEMIGIMADFQTLAAGHTLDLDLLESDVVTMTTVYDATPDTALVLDVLLLAQKGVPLSLRTLLASADLGDRDVKNPSLPIVVLTGHLLLEGHELVPDNLEG